MVMNGGGCIATGKDQSATRPLTLIGEAKIDDLRDGD